MGISREQVHFLDSFLLHCLLDESPDCNKDEFFEVANNLNLVVNRGREPNLLLSSEGKKRKLKDWSMELINDIILLKNIKNILIQYFFLHHILI